jgi:hypothetical protein
MEFTRNDRLNLLPDDEMYYIQDTRGYVGNCVLWWQLKNSGYTTNIDLAEKYTKEEMLDICLNGRETDVPWIASHIEENLTRHVDMQNLDSTFCVK